MTKYPCELIEDLLILYLEDTVSPVTRQLVEEHLQDCPKCRDLLAIYSCQEPALPALQESLPQADTFKSWMKRLQYLVITIIFLLLAILAGTAVLSYKSGSIAAKEILTAKDVLVTMKAQRINFKPEDSLRPENYEFSGMTPEIYKDGRDNLLFIYTFESFKERQQTREHELAEMLGQKLNPEGLKQKNKIFYVQPYRAKNILLAYALPFTNNIGEQENNQIASNDLERMNQIIFSELNDGRELIFTGQGQNWAAKVTLRYYENWWTDQENKMHYESWHTEQHELTFKGKTREDGHLEVSFNSNSGSAKSSRDISAQAMTRVIRLGSSGGNGAMPRENDVYEVTVDFNGQKETFELKAANVN